MRGENVVLLGEVVRRSASVVLSHLRVLNRYLTQDLDLEDAPLEALTLVPWQQLSAALTQEKKAKLDKKHQHEQVLFKRQGFGEEGGEGDAY